MENYISNYLLFEKFVLKSLFTSIDNANSKSICFKNHSQENNHKCIEEYTYIPKQVEEYLNNYSTTNYFYYLKTCFCFLQEAYKNKTELDCVSLNNDKRIINNSLNKSLMLDFLYQGSIQNDSLSIYLLFKIHSQDRNQYIAAFVFLHRLIFNFDFVSETFISLKTIELEYYNFMKNIISLNDCEKIDNKDDINNTNNSSKEELFNTKLMTIYDEMQENNSKYNLQENEIKFIKSIIEGFIKLNINSLEEHCNELLSDGESIDDVQRLINLSKSTSLKEKVLCYVFCFKRLIKNFLTYDKPIGMDCINKISNKPARSINFNINMSKICFNWVVFFLIEEYNYYLHLYNNESYRSDLNFLPLLNDLKNEALIDLNNNKHTKVDKNDHNDNVDLDRVLSNMSICLNMINEFVCENSKQLFSFNSTKALALISNFILNIFYLDEDIQKISSIKNKIISFNKNNKTKNTKFGNMDSFLFDKQVKKLRLWLFSNISKIIDILDISGYYFLEAKLRLLQLRTKSKFNWISTNPFPQYLSIKHQKQSNLSYMEVDDIDQNNNYHGNNDHHCLEVNQSLSEINSIIDLFFSSLKIGNMKSIRYLFTLVTKTFNSQIISLSKRYNVILTVILNFLHTLNNDIIQKKEFLLSKNINLTEIELVELMLYYVEIYYKGIHVNRDYFKAQEILENTINFLNKNDLMDKFCSSNSINNLHRVDYFLSNINISANNTNDKSACYSNLYIKLSYLKIKVYNKTGRKGNDLKDTINFLLNDKTLLFILSNNDSESLYYYLKILNHNNDDVSIANSINIREIISHDILAPQDTINKKKNSNNNIINDSHANKSSFKRNSISSISESNTNNKYNINYLSRSGNDNYNNRFNCAYESEDSPMKEILTTKDYVVFSLLSTIKLDNYDINLENVFKNKLVNYIKTNSVVFSRHKHLQNHNNSFLNRNILIDKCFICKVNAQEIVAYPCSHKTLCIKCYQKLEKESKLVNCGDENKNLDMDCNNIDNCLQCFNKVDKYIKIFM